MNIRKIISQFQDQSYALAYTLIPDDLQAGQIVLDAFEITMVENQDIAESFAEGSVESYQQAVKDLEMQLMRKIVELSKKRYPQVKISLTDTRIVENPLFGLDLEEKAIIFLKYKIHTPINEIAELLRLDRYKVLSVIGKARETLRDGQLHA